MNLHKLLRLLFIFLFCIGVGSNAVAQLYISDHLYHDSVELKQMKVLKTDTITTEETLTIPNGLPLQYKSKGNDFFRVLVEYEGKLYSVHQEDIKFSDENAPGVINIAQKEEMADRHSEWGHFFHTMKPYYLIIVIMVFTWLLSWTMDNVSRFVFGILLFLIPIGLLAVSGLEFFTFTVNKHFLWWIDQDRLGFWKTALLMLPVILAILLQINSGLAYKEAVEDWCGKDLKWKPAFIGVAISVPLGIICAIICAIGEYGSAAENTAMAIGFGAPLVIAFLMCLIKNSNSLGFFIGFAFTLFSFIYAVGVVISVGLAIVVVFKLTITALMWLIPGAILLGGSGGYSGSSSSSSSSSGGRRGSYYNGKYYSSNQDANAARRRDREKASYSRK